MISYIIKATAVVAFAAILLICTGIPFDAKYEVSFYPKEALAFLVGVLVVLGIMNFLCKIVVQTLKKDVLLSNHAFDAEKEAVAALHNKDSNIVLSHSQFDEATLLVINIMGAITSGLMNDARRKLVELRKIIGDDAMIDILMLKIYKSEKNFDKMEEITRKLMQNENIQLVSMKTAIEAQMEKKDVVEALKTSSDILNVRHDLYWVLSSAFMLRAKNNDWLGALEILEAGITKNITSPHKASRLKAVALYELAQQTKNENDKTKYFKFITQALHENNKLIPAALDLADYYIKNDKQVRKAEQVLFFIWCDNPSYEIAKAYLDLFPEDTKSEKIQRMEKLALANTKRPALNNLILAELFMDAKKFAKARSECNLFLLKNPITEKLATILSQLNEEAQNVDNKSGKILKSIKNLIKIEKGKDYPKDFQWVCAKCGHVTDKWNAICPKCGEIGRCYWHLYVDDNTDLTDDM